MNPSKKSLKIHSWSEWTWSEEDQIYVRAGLDKQGRALTYDYQRGDPPLPVTGGSKDVDALAAELGGVNINPQGYDHGYDDTASYPQPHSYPGEGYPQGGYPDGTYQHGGYPEGEYPEAEDGDEGYDLEKVQSSGSHKSKGKDSKSKGATKSSSSGKPKSRKAGKDQDFVDDPGRDKNYDLPPKHQASGRQMMAADPNETTQPVDPGYGYSTGVDPGQDQSYAGTAPFQGAPQEGHHPIDPDAGDLSSTDPAHYHPGPLPGDPSHTQHGKSRKGKAKDSKGPSVKFNLPAEPLLPAEEEDDPALREAIAQSKGMYESPYGQSSSYMAQPTYEEGTTPYDGYGYDEEPPASAATNLGGGDYVQANLSTGLREQLDPRYQVEPSLKFQPGEVFKVLWSEPYGSRNQDTRMTDNETKTFYGEKFYVSFRRFVVVANDEGHCTCVPILTYERRGCTKRGVKAPKHGAVFPAGGKPKFFPAEPPLGFQPVALQIDIPSEKLAWQSRINYSKLITVEHNVKVFFIGRIWQTDFNDIVTAAVDKCWEDKIRQTRKKDRDHRPHH